MLNSIVDLINSSSGMIVGVIASMLAGVMAKSILRTIEQLIEKQLIPSLTIVLVELDKRLKAPKWYHNNAEAIDPGLIEVAVAITAVVIALPSFVNLDISTSQATLFKIFRFFGEFIPTIASINLLDRYAKNKGSTSKHILLSPIADGSFFLLGWSIVLVFIIISIVVLLAG